MAAEDWDLYAVVRSCTNKTAATADGNTATAASCNNESENPFACLSNLILDNDDPFTFPDLEQPRNNAFDELNQLYKAFLTPAGAGAGDVNASVSDLREVKLEPRHQQQKKQKVSENVSVTNSLLGDSRAKQQTPCVQQREAHHRGIHEEAAGTSAGSVVPFLAMPPPPQISPRLRKRKNQQKRMVCEVKPENLSSDMWAWRKYGQKPIKGSPYPRNYYRCSSSKGCSARKQVEKSTTDPNIFVVTYTGDHSHPRPTHRNSLAGSTRNKLSHPSRGAGQDSDQPNTVPVCSSPLSPTTPLTSAVDRPAPKAEIEDEDDYVAGIEDDDVAGLLIPNKAVTEDFFMGVEEIMGYGGDSGFGQNLGFMGGLPGRKRRLESSWVAAAGGSAAAGAASGGGC